MSSPPINPPDTYWYEITAECVQCGTEVYKEGRTDLWWVRMNCPVCEHFWDIEKEDL